VKISVSFPQTKISEAFLNFAEPRLGTEPQSRTREEVDGALKLALIVWNAVVFDTVRGNTDWVMKVRKQVVEQPPIAALVEELIARKQTQLGYDLRLVGRYEIVERDGEWRLHVEARSPSSAEEPGGTPPERVAADTAPPGTA
jgi:hypothetical protein